MRYIFDFDDVLFNTEKFKEHEFACMKKIGISHEIALHSYEKIREAGKLFSLKYFLSDLFVVAEIKGIEIEEIYEDIMGVCKTLLNKEVFQLIQKLGRENCFIVTHGDREFQMDKIKRTGIVPLFSEIVIVPGSKKEMVEKICAKYKNEEVFFIDDKEKYFEDLDLKKCPNLKTILYSDSLLYLQQ